MSTHVHDRQHDQHSHDWRESNPPPGGPSMLDIGGDVGAAIVELAADTPTGELMACRLGRPDEHFHTGVHLRTSGETQSWVAVFPSIVEGEYSLLDDDGRELMPFTIVGGEVTSLSLVEAETMSGHGHGHGHSHGHGHGHVHGDG